MVGCVQKRNMPPRDVFFLISDREHMMNQGHYRGYCITSFFDNPPKATKRLGMRARLLGFNPGFNPEEWMDVDFDQQFPRYDVSNAKRTCNLLKELLTKKKNR